MKRPIPLHNTKYANKHTQFTITGSAQRRLNYPLHFTHVCRLSSTRTGLLATGTKKTPFVTLNWMSSLFRLFSAPQGKSREQRRRNSSIIHRLFLSSLCSHFLACSVSYLLKSIQSAPLPFYLPHARICSLGPIQIFKSNSHLLSHVQTFLFSRVVVLAPQLCDIQLKHVTHVTLTIQHRFRSSVKCKGIQIQPSSRVAKRQNLNASPDQIVFDNLVFCSLRMCNVLCNAFAAFDGRPERKFGM